MNNTLAIVLQRKSIYIFFLIICLHLSASAQSGIKIQHGPYLQNVGENEVTILWITSKDAMSWVEVAPDDESHFYADERPQYFQTENGRKLVGKLHQILIKGRSEEHTSELQSRSHILCLLLLDK